MAGRQVPIAGTVARVDGRSADGSYRLTAEDGATIVAGQEAVADAANAARLEEDADLIPSDWGGLTEALGSMDRYEETLAAIFGDAGGQVRMNWAPPTVHPSTIDVEGSIHDPVTGTYWGSINRQFKRDGSVYHSLFSIGNNGPPGLAVRINRQAEQAYAKMGVGSISLDADINIGKYAWARQGYDWRPGYGEGLKTSFDSFVMETLDSHPEAWVGLKLADGTEVGSFEGGRYGGSYTFISPSGATVQRSLTEGGRMIADQAWERMLAENGGLRHSWDLASASLGVKLRTVTDSQNTDTDSEYDIGKAFMLSSSMPNWSGRKDLTDGSPHRAIGDAYMGVTDAGRVERQDDPPAPPEPQRGAAQVSQPDDARSTDQPISERIAYAGRMMAREMRALPGQTPTGLRGRSPELRQAVVEAADDLISTGLEPQAAIDAVMTGLEDTMLLMMRDEAARAHGTRDPQELFDADVELNSAAHDIAVDRIGRTRMTTDEALASIAMTLGIPQPPAASSQYDTDSVLDDAYAAAARQMGQPNISPFELARVHPGFRRLVRRLSGGDGTMSDDVHSTLSMIDRVVNGTVGASDGPGSQPTPPAPPVQRPGRAPALATDAADMAVTMASEYGFPEDALTPRGVQFMTNERDDFREMVAEYAATHGLGDPSSFEVATAFAEAANDANGIDDAGRSYHRGPWGTAVASRDPVALAASVPRPAMEDALSTVERMFDDALRTGDTDVAATMARVLDVHGDRLIAMADNLASMVLGPDAPDGLHEMVSEEIADNVMTTAIAAARRRALNSPASDRPGQWASDTLDAFSSDDEMFSPFHRPDGTIRAPDPFYLLNHASSRPGRLNDAAEARAEQLVRNGDAVALDDGFRRALSEMMHEWQGRYDEQQRERSQPQPQQPASAPLRPEPTLRRNPAQVRTMLDMTEAYMADVATGADTVYQGQLDRTTSAIQRLGLTNPRQLYDAYLEGSFTHDESDPKAILYDAVRDLLVSSFMGRMSTSERIVQEDVARPMLKLIWDVSRGMSPQDAARRVLPAGGLTPEQRRNAAVDRQRALAEQNGPGALYGLGTNAMRDDPSAPAFTRPENRHRITGGEDVFDWDTLGPTDVPRSPDDYRRFLEEHGMRDDEETRRGWEQSKYRWGIDRAIIKSMRRGERQRRRPTPFILPYGKKLAGADDSRHWDLDDEADERWRRAVREARDEDGPRLT